jgi:pimeloyl-ACP methyl ester carboxylesterase
VPSKGPEIDAKVSLRSYEHAQERLAQFLARDHDGIGELGRTLVFDHGRRTERATLLFHGLSASPRQFIEVARALHERGHNVLVPRLPRHGYGDRLSAALADMNAAQLKACAADTLEMARGLGERVTVAGFSLGGLLAAYLGQFNDVQRVVAISPFLGVSFVPSFFRLHFANWLLRRRNRFYWWDPLLRERQLPEHGYPRYASHALAHGLTLAHELMEAAEKQAPQAQEIVVVINTREPAVNNRAIMKLVKKWRVHKPEAVRVHRLTGLPIAHDIVEPKRYPEIARRVLPVLVELIDP